MPSALMGQKGHEADRAYPIIKNGPRRKAKAVFKFRGTKRLAQSGTNYGAPGP
jgi:hypothetical protein